MKRTALLTLILFIAAFTAKAQKLVIGEKSPDMKVKEWLSGQPTEGGLRFVEFFHTSSKQCVARLATIDGVAKKYKGRLSVILIAKEPADKVKAVVSPGSKAFYTAIDDAGKTFDSFGVQFVPFSVLVDKKGRVIWFGNPSSFDESIISRNL